MITEVKKTVVRRLTVATKKGERRAVVIYIMPSGLLAFRFNRCRRRYWIPIERVLALAIQNGPAEGLLETMLDEKARGKRGKGNDRSVPAAVADGVAPDKAD